LAQFGGNDRNDRGPRALSQACRCAPADADGIHARGLAGSIGNAYNAPPVRLPYPLLCTLLGFILGWLPRLVHGPIPEKFDVLYIKGAIAVWGFYAARLSIGFFVGNTLWPAQWYARGPLCGFLAMLPLGLIALATPGCGFR